MKTYTLFNTFLSIFLIYEANKSNGLPLDFATPPVRHFQFLTFDLVHRGSFNISDCVKDMINCWEVIKPDIICSTSGVMFESVCGVVRDGCDDRLGWEDRNEVPIFESFCRHYRDEMYT